MKLALFLFVEYEEIKKKIELLSKEACYCIQGLWEVCVSPVYQRQDFGHAVVRATRGTEHWAAVLLVKEHSLLSRNYQA